MVVGGSETAAFALFWCNGGMSVIHLKYRDADSPTHARRVGATRGCTGNRDSFAGLPVEFCAELPFATTVARTGHHTKRAAIKIAAGIGELRMIRDIEEFKAQLKRERFLNDCPLRDAQIGVVDTGTVEELAIGIAKCPEWARCECFRKEVRVRTIGSRLPGILSLDWADQVRNIRVGTTCHGLITSGWLVNHS
jgi:hypothetical protein